MFGQRLNEQCSMFYPVPSSPNWRPHTEPNHGSAHLLLFRIQGPKRSSGNARTTVALNSTFWSIPCANPAPYTAPYVSGAAYDHFPWTACSRNARHCFCTSRRSRHSSSKFSNRQVPVNGQETGAPHPPLLDAQHRPITAGGFVKTGPVVFEDVSEKAGLTHWTHKMGTPPRATSSRPRARV
jgi:hypothetical protein